MYIKSLVSISKSHIVVVLNNGDYMKIYCIKGEFQKEVNKQIITCPDSTFTHQAIHQIKAQNPNYPLALHIKDYKFVPAYEFMEDFITTDVKVAAWFKSNIYDLMTQSIDFGIVIHEPLINFQPISKLLSKSKISKRKKDLYVGIYAFTLIIEAVYFGFLHKCDDSGVYIDITDDTFFRGLTGRPVVVDFSKTEEIPFITMAALKILFESKQYSDIMVMLHRSEDGDPCKSHLHIIEQPTKEFNDNVDYLINLRANMLKQNFKQKNKHFSD